MHTSKYNTSKEEFFARPSQRYSIPLLVMQLFLEWVSSVQKQQTEYEYTQLQYP